MNLGTKRPIEEHIKRMTPKQRDWLEVYGNQYRPARVMPGTCEACVWGCGTHSMECGIRSTIASEHAKVFSRGIQY